MLRRNETAQALIARTNEPLTLSFPGSSAAQLQIQSGKAAQRQRCGERADPQTSVPVLRRAQKFTTAVWRDGLAADGHRLRSRPLGISSSWPGSFTVPERPEVRSPTATRTLWAPLPLYQACPLIGVVRWPRNCSCWALLGHSFVHSSRLSSRPSLVRAFTRVPDLRIPVLAQRVQLIIMVGQDVLSFSLSSLEASPALDDVMRALADKGKAGRGAQ